MKAFIPKQNHALPDVYGLTIEYNAGGKETVEIASHKFITELRAFEYVTSDDLWELVPFESIKRIKFDKSFSKIVAAREKEMKSKN
jgi:hypothetical protein